MIAEVIVDITSSTTDKIFDYSIPDGLDVKVGHRVVVMFGSKKVDGFVINIKETSNYDLDKIKDIVSVKEAQPLLTQNMLRLCFFMKKNFYLRAIDVIKLCLPPIVISGKVKAKYIEYVLPNFQSIPVLSQKAKEQIRLLLFLQERGEVKKEIILKEFSSSTLKNVLQKGFAIIKSVQEDRKPKSTFTVKKKEIVLNKQQQEAVDKITKSKYATYLLHGVTGSGKTEVYINCIKNALKQGKTAIMLVPEISLTPQMFARFRNAFGDTVAILHSNLSQGERFDEWNRIKNKQAKIAIGARSCIFAPIEDLGIIIIDEEHDSSYFSQSNPRFHTHEVAKYLAYLNNCPLVLGSATPSVESYYLASTGEYRLLTLTDRANQKQMPNIEIVDMMLEPMKGNINIFSYRLIAELESCLAQNNQAMIFINRRGYSSFIMCNNCAYVPKCQDCDVSLVYHKEDDMLKCHYCDKRYKKMTVCPKCGSSSIRYGAIGTQRVVDELKKIFDVPIFRLDNDTTRNKNSYAEILEQFNNTSPSILVGTQMIAKGHDFNNVTLVGIVDADVSLHFSDYRAIERTFQLITQVAGRAGRSDSEGKVVLQTYFPRHYAYRYASTYDYKAFFKREINLREVTKFPPFVHLLRVLVISENFEKAEIVLKNIYDEINFLQQTYSSDFVYLHAMKCPKKRIQKNFRYQIMMRINKKNQATIIPKIYEICDKCKQNKVSIFVEDDPQNLS